MQFTDMLLFFCASDSDYYVWILSDGEHGFRYFQMASCGQDNHIKLWHVLFADFLGLYSDVFFIFQCLKSLVTVYIQDQIYTAVMDSQPN